MINNSQWEIDHNGHINEYELELAYWVDVNFRRHRDGAASQRVLKESYQVQSFLGEWRLFKWFIDLLENYNSR